MTGKSENSTLADRDEAGNRLPREGNLGLADPTSLKVFPQPRRDLVFLWGEGSPYDNTVYVKPIKYSCRSW
jgi:hypothetical protein